MGKKKKTSTPAVDTIDGQNASINPTAFSCNSDGTKPTVEAVGPITVIPDKRGVRAGHTAIQQDAEGNWSG